MKHLISPKCSGQAIRSGLTLASSLVACSTLTGCLVFGYSSSGGWFLWPGSISLIILILLLVWLLRR